MLSHPALRRYAAAFVIGLSFIVRPTLAQSTPAAAEGVREAQRVADSVRVVRIVENQREIEERNRTFKFGLSVGWRHIIADRSSFYRDAVLNPVDSTVQVDTVDTGDVVLSAVIVAYPWTPPEPGEELCCGMGSQLWRLGFIANVDLAAFGSDENVGLNRTIEGGGGLAWRFNTEFSTALTVERVFSRRLRSHVIPGQRLLVAQGTQNAPFSRTNDLYFRDDNLTAVSLKFVYFIR